MAAGAADPARVSLVLGCWPRRSCSAGATTCRQQRLEGLVRGYAGAAEGRRDARVVLKRRLIGVARCTGIFGPSGFRVSSGS